MKKILFVHHSSEFYGSDKILFEVVTRLDPQRYFPIVLLPGAGILHDRLRERGVDTRVGNVAPLSRRVLTAKGALSYLPKFVASVAGLMRLMRGEAVDLVYSNTLAVVTPSIAASIVRVRHLWHVHEIINGKGPVASVYRLLAARFADTVICNSQATCDAISLRQSKLLRKTCVVRNGIPMGPWSDVVSSAASTARAEAVVLGLVGRVNGAKGHAEALYALHKLCERMPELDIRMLFVGGVAPTNPDELQKIAELIRSLSLQGRVVMHAYTDDIDTVWSSIDIALVPSTIPESFGLVAVEAMAHGKPVIASDLGGLREVVEDNVTGVLVPVGDVELLADAMGSLATDNTRRRMLGEAGRLRAEAGFDVTRMIREISDVIG